ncbi:MAG: pcrA [Patescibacteria group bacterium]|nr:pcrA [Patescibacteria group bacterium]
MNYLETLNPKQAEAVLATEGPLLIVAGAGTGKTKTLTHRIYHLIHQGVHPRSILAITFTNKAAKEMRERVMHMLEADKGGTDQVRFHEVPLLCTFHSLGVRILRRFHQEAGLKKSFAILDSQDTMKIVKEAMEMLGINPKVHEPKKIRNFISSKKSDGFSAADFAKATHSAFTEIVTAVWTKYEELKSKESGVDFDDLLLKTLELLEKNIPVRKALQNEWKYIHIDEYQDTNQVQYRIVQLLAESHHNLCVVGDTDQNIYSWRGANLRNILNFEKDYPESQVILLEENYRSTKNILTAADEVIKKNTARIHKELRTKQGDGEKIKLFTAMNEGDEARHIAATAEELISKGNSPTEIAVLYRTNFQSRVLEEAFLHSGVPYQLLGTKFFERKEIKDTVAYIRAAFNRDGLSDIKRIINEPKRGLGPAAVAKVFSGMKTDLPPAQRRSYDAFESLLDLIANYASNHTPSELMRFVIEKSGFYDIYKNGTEDDHERLENLEELVTFATRYDTIEPEDEPLQKMLEDVALQSDQDQLDDANKKSGVKLMTIHSAKGLEFDYVFIGGLEQGLFPHDGFDEKKTIEDQEEERRLFYVALTRARKCLMLSYAMMRTIYGEQTFNMPSEFLADIPEEIIIREDSFGGDAPSPIKTVYLDW